jgi:hypothetical protein
MEERGRKKGRTGVFWFEEKKKREKKKKKKKNPDPSFKLGSDYLCKTEERDGQFAIFICFIY